MWTTVEVNGSTADGDEPRIGCDQLDTVRVILNEDGTEPRATCTHCGDAMDPDQPDRSKGENSDPEWCADNPDGDEDTSPHVGQTNPHTWANSARIILDDERDAIHVTVSYADPRGSFALTVERMEDGTMRLTVPHPDDSQLHAPLTEIHPGHYKIDY